MKYPPKETRSTCHCRVNIKQKFINHKTKASDVYSKMKCEKVTPLLLCWCSGLLWPQNVISNTKLPNQHLNVSPLHVLHLLGAQHTKKKKRKKDTSIKGIPLYFKCKAATTVKLGKGAGFCTRSSAGKEPPRAARKRRRQVASIASYGSGLSNHAANAGAFHVSC